MTAVGSVATSIVDMWCEIGAWRVTPRRPFERCDPLSISCPIALKDQADLWLSSPQAIDRVKFHVYNTHRHLLDIATKANIVMTASAGSSTYLSLHTDACTVRTTCMTDFALQRIIWRKWRSDLNVAMIVETLSTMTPGMSQYYSYSLCCANLLLWLP